MMTPFSDIDTAYFPFLDTPITISGRRGNQTFTVGQVLSIVDDKTETAFDDVSPDSDDRKIIVISTCGEYGWNRADTPQIGDTVQFTNGRKYSVIDVGEFSKKYLRMETRPC